MTYISDDILRKVQLTELSILKEIDRVCKDNNISYVMFGGTLLGAIRHKGFIPWDDDLDIAMLREDYEKFIEVAPQALPDTLFLQTYKSDPCYPLPFAKVRFNNTKWVEKPMAHLNIHHGIFVDVFPLDQVPDNYIKKQLYRFLVWIGMICCRAKQKSVKHVNHHISKSFGYYIINKLLFTVPLGEIVSKCEKSMKIFYKDNTRKVASAASGYHFDKVTIPLEYIENRCLLQFEDGEFYAPSDCQTVLTRMYGDYMTPPPEHKRSSKHNIVEYKLPYWEIA